MYMIDKQKHFRPRNYNHTTLDFCKVKIEMRYSAYFSFSEGRENVKLILFNIDNQNG